MAIGWHFNQRRLAGITSFVGFSSSELRYIGDSVWKFALPVFIFCITMNFGVNYCPSVTFPDCRIRECVLRKNTINKYIKDSEPLCAGGEEKEKYSVGLFKPHTVCMCFPLHNSNARGLDIAPGLPTLCFFPRAFKSYPVHWTSFFWLSLLPHFRASWGRGANQSWYGNQTVVTSSPWKLRKGLR